jgi:hypothetical protein
MSGQGYHLALRSEQCNQLLSFDDELDILDCANQILEATWAEPYTWAEPNTAASVHGGYKDWNVLLCCLTNGSYDPKGGSYPLNRCFFGGRLLVREGSIVNLVMPAEVRDVSEALDKIDKADFSGRYMRLPQDEFRRENWAKDEEYQYDLWMRLNRLKKFYRWAAEEGHAVMFFTDDPLDYFYKPDSDCEAAPG